MHFHGEDAGNRHPSRGVRGHVGHTPVLVSYSFYWFSLEVGGSMKQDPRYRKKYIITKSNELEDLRITS